MTIATTGTTSGSIPINTGTVVNADAYCGAGGNPSSVISVAGTATLNGTKGALTQNPTFGDVTMPSSLSVKSTGQVHISANTTWTPTKSGKYHNLYIDAGKTLTISGGTVVIGIDNTSNNGFLDIGAGSKITVASGSTLIVYLDGNLNTGNNDISIQYAGGKDPSRIQIYGTAAQASMGWPQINFHSTSSITAYIYAPYAHVNIVNNTTFYGAIVATDVGFNDYCKFYYDTALQGCSTLVKGISAGSTSSGFTVKRWSESVSEVPDWAY
jgi:hypothetical protein